MGYNKRVDPDYLHVLFSYSPLTGDLQWRRRTPDSFLAGGSQSPFHNCAIWNGKRLGKTVGIVNRDGYIRVQFMGSTYQAHWVAWAMHYGRWPSKQLDHINGNPRDNRIENLREVDHAGNGRNRAVSRNSTTGVTGVTKRGDRYVAQIKSSGKIISLGRFLTLSEAAQARSRAEADLGFHPNHGMRKSVNRFNGKHQDSAP